MAPVSIASDVSNDATDHDLELLTGGDVSGMLKRHACCRWRHTAALASPRCHASPGRGTTVSYGD